MRGLVSADIMKHITQLSRPLCSSFSGLQIPIYYIRNNSYNKVNSYRIVEKNFGTITFLVLNIICLALMNFVTVNSVPITEEKERSFLKNNIFVGHDAVQCGRSSPISLTKALPPSSASTFKMEAWRLFETSVNVYQITRLHIPQDSIHTVRSLYLTRSKQLHALEFHS